MTLQQQARDIVKIMSDSYETHKHHPLFTLWGIASFWKDGKFINEPTGDHPEFISDLLEAIDDGNFKDQETGDPITYRHPPSNWPKRSNPFLHYTTICQYNRDTIEKVMGEFLEKEFDDFLPVLNDKRLATEAVADYVQRLEDGTLEKDTYFIKFMIEFDKEQNNLIEDEESQGTYGPLSQRVYLRFGEKKFVEEAATLVGGPQSKEMLRLNNLALYGEGADVEDRLIAWNEELNEENGIKETYEQPEDRERVTGIEFRRVVRVTKARYGVNFDWSHILKERDRVKAVAKWFNQRSLSKDSIRTKLLNKYLLLYQIDPEKALQEVQEKRDDSKGVDQEVYSEVAHIIEGMDLIRKSPHITHELPVYRRNGNGGT